MVRGPPSLPRPDWSAGAVQLVSRAAQLRIAIVQSEPHEFSLDADQFDRLTRILKRAGITSAQTAQTLARAVAATMSACRAENAEGAGAATFRAKHDSLRALWRFADQPDPPVGQIRARLKELPPEVLADIEERAERRWPVYFHEPAPAALTAGWLANVPPEKLVEILPPSISYGGGLIPGRSRGSGQRSRPSYEPMIMGVVRGSGRPSRLETAGRIELMADGDAIANGRPRDDAAVRLISFLAVDWTLVTEQRPVRGRSDKSPFGDLVHQVFGWLGLPDAAGALRRYWREFAQRVEREPAADHGVDFT
jgi:hypothetical protein